MDLTGQAGDTFPPVAATLAVETLNTVPRGTNLLSRFISISYPRLYVHWHSLLMFFTGFSTIMSFRQASRFPDSVFVAIHLFSEFFF